MKKVLYLVLPLLLAALSGCCGSGAGDADLVVVNDSAAVIYSIGVSGGAQTQVVANADGRGLLERGESFGLELETQEELTVTLSGEGGRALARARVDYRGERLFLTLEEDGGVSCTEEG